MDDGGRGEQRGDTPAEQQEALPAEWGQAVSLAGAQTRGGRGPRARPCERRWAAGPGAGREGEARPNLTRA